MSVFSLRLGLVDRIIACFDALPEPTPDTETDRLARREARRLILECDPQACGSELGAQFLMSQFPRDF